MEKKNGPIVNSSFVAEDELDPIVEEELDFDISKYRPIKLVKFYQFSEMNINVYVKVGKDKYLKVISAGDHIDSKRLDGYKEKNVDSLFISSEDYESFKASFLDSSIDMLEKADSLNASVETRVTAELVCMSNIQDNLLGFGLNENMKHKVSKYLDSSVKTLESMPDMKSILNRIMRGKDYFSEHSLMISYIAGQISTATPWKSNSAIEKLAMAAILHDYGLMDSTFIQEHDQLDNFLGLDVPDIKLIKAHPIKGADYINSGQQIFADVDIIISQHHETPWRDSYPRKIGAQKISPLSCVFIIAEKYVNAIYGKNIDEVDMEEFKNDLKENCYIGNFKKVVDAFNEVF